MNAILYFIRKVWNKIKRFFNTRTISTKDGSFVIKYDKTQLIVEDLRMVNDRAITVKIIPKGQFSIRMESNDVFGRELGENHYYIEYYAKEV